MKRYRLIPQIEYIDKYNRMSVENKRIAASLSGAKSCNIFKKKRFITEYYYNKFIEFYNDKYEKSPNTLGQPVPFDIEQLKQYYKGLNDLIESDDYVKLSQKNSSRIVEEQKRISKLVNN